MKPGEDAARAGVKAESFIDGHFWGKVLLVLIVHDSGESPYIPGSLAITPQAVLEVAREVRL